MILQLRKASERIQTVTKPNERNSLLEQIRTKVIAAIFFPFSTFLLYQSTSRNLLQVLIQKFSRFGQSFNLKPAVAAKPIIHGPNTNLNVVAILEKANAIRQVNLISGFLVFFVCHSKSYSHYLSVILLKFLCCDIGICWK